MTKKNRHFKKSRKNVRRKNNQVGGAITEQNIRNLTKMATSGLDILITIEKRSTLHAGAINSVKLIIQSANNALIYAINGQMNPIYVEIVTIAKELENILQSLSDEDFQNMARLLHYILDEFGKHIEIRSRKNMMIMNNDVDWLDEFRVNFNTYSNNYKDNTLDISISSLMESQIIFIQEYMGPTINKLITKQIDKINKILIGEATRNNDIPDPPKDYTLLKVIIASFVCTLEATETWNHRDKLKEVCQIISLILDGNIFEKLDFYKSLQTITSSLDLWGTGLTFTILLTGNYVATYASSFTETEYEKMKQCRKQEELIQWTQNNMKDKNGNIGNIKEMIMKIEGKEDVEEEPTTMNTLARRKPHK